MLHGLIYDIDNKQKDLIQYLNDLQDIDIKNNELGKHDYMRIIKAIEYLEKVTHDLKAINNNL